MTEMNPTLFAILSAVSRGDHDGAVALATDVLEDEDDHRLVLLEMALLGVHLHKSPGMPIELMPIIDQIDGESLLGADVAGEVLDVVEQLLAAGPTPGPDGLAVLSEESRAILDRSNLRPGSAKATEAICRVIVALLAQMSMKLMLAGRWEQSSQDITDAIAKVRSVMEAHRPLPDADA